MFTGAVHENAIYVKFVFASSLVKAVGGSGTVAFVDVLICTTEVRVLVPTLLIDAI